MKKELKAQVDDFIIDSAAKMAAIKSFCFGHV